jgi:hypothetical protein
VKPLPDFRKGEAGEFLVQRMMPARRIDDDETIAPVACRQHQARRIERRSEGRAAGRALQAIENHVADLLEVGVEPTRFLEFVPSGGAGLGISRAGAADDPEAEFLFEGAR